MDYNPELCSHIQSLIFTHLIPSNKILDKQRCPHLVAGWFQVGVEVSDSERCCISKIASGRETFVDHFTLANNGGPQYLQW